MLKFFGTLTAYACTIPAIVLRGYVLSVLWGWFIVPLGVPAVDIALAIGISCVITLLTYTPFAAERADLDNMGELEKLFVRTFTSCFMSLSALLTGYIVTLFM